MRKGLSAIRQIVVDVDAQRVSIQLVDSDGAWYVESTAEVSMKPGEASTEFVADVRVFGEKVLAAVTQAQASDCGSCTASCCSTFDVVEVTDSDLHEMRKQGIDSDEYVVRLDTQTLTGAVAQMKKSSGSRCYALDGFKCGIYEARPAACRNFSAHTCGMYDRRVDGKRRLKVLTK